MGDINDRDDIEALKKASKNKKRFTDEEIKALRKEVEVIIRRSEEEKRRKQIAEMERRLYDLSIYA